MTIPEQLNAFYEEEDRQEALEHRDVLLAIRALLKTKEGEQFFTYLFKNLDVMCVPEQKEGNELYEYLGFLRAGNSIFKLASESSSEIAATILAKLERKKHERIYEKYRIENGVNIN